VTTVDTDGGSSDSIQCQLTDEQIDQLRRRGTEETVFEGDILVEEGEMEANFFVILEGEVMMYQERGGERTSSGRATPVRSARWTCSTSLRGRESTTRPAPTPLLTSRQKSVLTEAHVNL
jgi:hypothetical protein